MRAAPAARTADRLLAQLRLARRPGLRRTRHHRPVRRAHAAPDRQPASKPSTRSARSRRRTRARPTAPRSRAPRRRLARQTAAPGAPHDAGSAAPSQLHAVAGPLPLRADRARAAARRAGRSARQRSAGRRRPRRGRALSARRGLAARNPASAPGGKRQTPRLRAVAWPTTGRAPSPSATAKMAPARCGCGAVKPGCGKRTRRSPLNFRGNLLGIAFDPNNSSRGYAVGQQGVLLSYGKSWVQERRTEHPAGGARGAASPRSPSPARKRSSSGASCSARAQNRYARRRDRQRRLRLAGTTKAPTPRSARAPCRGRSPALPDGGAAFTAEEPGAGRDDLRAQRARSSRGRPSPTPGGRAGLARACSAKAERCARSAAAANRRRSRPKKKSRRRPGSRRSWSTPYPLAIRSRPRRAAPDGERLERRGARTQRRAENRPATTSFYDTPYDPRPGQRRAGRPERARRAGRSAGVVNNEDRAARHGGRLPLPGGRHRAGGAATAQVIAEPERQPGEPPAGDVRDRRRRAVRGAVRGPRRHRVGPDVWLASAQAEADQIEGVRAFIYTGGRVTTGQTAGPAELVVPYAAEQARYAEILSSPNACPHALAHRPRRRRQRAHVQGRFPGSSVRRKAGAARLGAPTTRCPKRRPRRCV